MTAGGILAASAPYLEGRGVAGAHIAAQHLLARLMRCKRLDLALKTDETLSQDKVEAMRRGVARLAAGEPLQYVLGRWDFRGLTLKTDRRALIPRPETEQLVQLFFDSGVMDSAPEPRVLDYGTGGGCIALSIASEAPAARVAAADVSAEALALAHENAAEAGLAGRVRFINNAEAELTAVFDEPCFEAVVSNPPYISSAVCRRLPRSVRDFEPALALDGGPDGMEALRAVIDDAAMLLVSGGALFLEIGAEEGQAEPLTRFLEGAGFDEIRIAKDLRGAGRFIHARLGAGL